jgi:hypothetical protein
VTVAFPLPLAVTVPGIAVLAVAVGPPAPARGNRHPREHV